MKRIPPAKRGAQKRGQLPMFMPAGELRKVHPHPGDLAQVEDAMRDEYVWDLSQKNVTARLWEEKEEEATEPTSAGGESVWESIERTRQVRTPVYLSHEYEEPAIASGHHRIAAASAIDPHIEVPVEHYEDLGRATMHGQIDQKNWERKGTTARPRDYMTPVLMATVTGHMGPLPSSMAREIAPERQTNTQTYQNPFGDLLRVPGHHNRPSRMPMRSTGSSGYASEDYYARALARGRL